jgi:type IV pilus assembly protein PilM
MFGFGRKQRALLGVDIGSSAVKLVELAPGSANKPEHFRVEALALESLPSQTLVEKKIADVTLVGQAIATALQRSQSKTRRAVVAVAGSAVITKVLSLSAELSDAEMEAQIQLEADQYVPYPLEEVNLDFDVLGPTEGSADMVDVLLAASRQDNVDDRVAALELAGLSVEIVDIESNAVENAGGVFINKSEPKANRLIAVADIGATTTTLHVLRDGQNIYAREQSFGGQQLVEEVQRRSALGREEALSQLSKAPIPPQLQALVLGPFEDALARQLARALQFFYSTSAFSQVDEVLLTGGVTQVPDLARQIAERLALPVQIADPFAQMSLSADAERVLSQYGRSTMLIAVGLAMRRFH